MSDNLTENTMKINIEKIFLLLGWESWETLQSFFLTTRSLFVEFHFFIITTRNRGIFFSNFVLHRILEYNFEKRSLLNEVFNNIISTYQCIADQIKEICEAFKTCLPCRVLLILLPFFRVIKENFEFLQTKLAVSIRIQLKHVNIVNLTTPPPQLFAFTFVIKDRISSSESLAESFLNSLLEM